MFKIQVNYIFEFQKIQNQFTRLSPLSSETLSAYFMVDVLHFTCNFFFKKKKKNFFIL